MKKLLTTTKSGSINHQRLRSILAFLMIGAITLALTPRSAWATDQVPFRASFTTEFDSVVNFPIVSVFVTGEGKASHMGRTTGVTTNQQLNLITGIATATYTLTAANGDTLTLEFIAPVNIPIPGGILFSGTFSVTDGTGRFAGATGGGTFSGSATYTGPTNGFGAFTLVGTVSSPGSLK